MAKAKALEPERCPWGLEISAGHSWADRFLCPCVHPANPLGILVANLLSPALVKKGEDIPLMVREIMRCT